MVVDTSIFIEYLRATNKANTTLQKLPDQSILYVSSITLYELYMGATSPSKWVDVRTITEDIPILPLDQSVAEKAAVIYQQLKKANQLIEFRDIFIGATALVHQLPVLTKNSKHFQRISGLMVTVK
ncbi:MAG: type II toxin-antitoxin system VapC family toxin [Cyclobacteriaceae bacterium]